jgi:uncharacterized membrane protein
MTDSRRLAVLMLFSALVSPRQALAACESSPMNIEQRFGRDVALSVLTNVALGAVSAAAVAYLAVGAVGAVAVFTGVVAFRGLLPAMRRGADSAFLTIDNAVFQISE